MWVGNNQVRDGFGHFSSFVYFCVLLLVAVVLKALSSQPQLLPR